MDSLVDDLKKAYSTGDGYGLSMTLSPIAPDSSPGRLQDIYSSSSFQQIQSELNRRLLYDQNKPWQLSHEQAEGWVGIYYAYWNALGEILKAEATQRANRKASWSTVYDAWKDVMLTLIRAYEKHGFEVWSVPCLYLIVNFQDDFNPETEKNEKLEDAARTLNRVFQLCLSDRAPLLESRKWAIYYIINLLFKTYFKLNSITLSKNILNALRAYRGDMPDLSAFPMSHQVTFKYYVGVISFLNEAYSEAETNLTEAWLLCHKDATRNKELILTYLVPCHLLTTHTLPTTDLLAPYPRLQNLFLPLCRCIKSGDLSGFDAALVAGENEFTKRRIYLTLERGRDIALRNLLRKVFLAGGYEEKDGERVRRTRIPVTEFGAAISLGSKERMDSDEVECLIANMIYKNLMKGYIARDRGTVVLSKTGSFPGTGV